MHLYWELPSGFESPPITMVEATLEIVEPPTVPYTYFWALQASFVDEIGTDHGAAHLGLQWYPPHPNAKAVNWGGYPPIHQGWQVTLAGSDSPLPSTTNDPNTRDYPWEPNRSYRLRIAASPDRGWRGTVIDLTTGDEQVVRDLWLGGDRLVGIVVWTEWFCRCSDPRVVARWSDFRATRSDGAMVRPDALRVSHPPDSRCQNVCHLVEQAGPDARVLQVMNRERSSRTPAHGDRIPVGSNPVL